MNDTDSTPGMRKDMYLGRASDSVTFMAVLGQISAEDQALLRPQVLGVVEAHGESLRYRRPSAVLMRMRRMQVVCLCFLELLHASATAVSRSVVPADITFNVENTNLWSIRLSFLLTACIAFLGQTYITYTMYQGSCKRSKSILFNMVWAVLALLFGIGAM
ncbi:hypothetical protein NM688_g1442 [Phlebia brevispora]|uniref:Uncharacterized protein n=1 Tax=Phlebia brevispora TaxID=194682 RepID=A0ACC1TBL1_9APHY|nr:hypothetical protein NM688_g1442 [Phlebia brevispora]